MRQATHSLTVDTPGRGLVEVTRPIVGWVQAQGMAEGLLTVFCRHTSAGLLIQENAAAEVRQDLEAFFVAIAPEDPGRYGHDDEGPDDMPAHLRTALTGGVPEHPPDRRAPAAGNLAGDLCFRTPPPSAPAGARAAFDGGMKGGAVAPVPSWPGQVIGAALRAAIGPTPGKARVSLPVWLPRRRVGRGFRLSRGVRARGLGRVAGRTAFPVGFQLVVAIEPGVGVGGGGLGHGFAFRLTANGKRPA